MAALGHTVDSGSGASGDYVSLNALGAAQEQDLTDGGGDTYTATCTTTGDNAADTTAVDFDGWTTGIANYILIEAASTDRAEAASYNANKYRMEVSGATALIIREDYVRVDGLQIQLTASSVSSIRGIVLTGQGASNDIRISNSRIKGVLSGTSVDCYGIYSGSTNVNLISWNIIVYGFVNGANNANGVYVRNASFAIYNSILYGNNVGVRIRDNAGTVKNTASFTNTDDFLDSVGGSTIDYCASDDGDGDHPVTPANWADVFENAAGGDFRLKATDTDLHDKGTDDPSGSGYGDPDIDETARVSLWDIGAFEYVAPAGGIVVLRRRRM